MTASAKIRRWREDPVSFVREVLCAEPDAWQAEVLQATRTHRRLCLKASKGPGKSTVLAWIGWWFLLTRFHPKVIATSVTGDNLRDGLWTEFSRWQGRSPLLKRGYRWGAERIAAVDHPETWWASARTWPRDADASRQADTLAGVHGDHVLFLMDEAGGIPDAVMAAAEGGLANADPQTGTREALLVIAGNPTETSGPLYRACTRERALWWVKEISGDPDDPARAPRVSAEWAREQIAKYGRDNAWVRVNVFGQFPPGQSNALMGVEDVSAASQRVIQDALFTAEPKVLGVDVARFGDDRTVIQPRQGRVALRPRTFRNLDLMEVSGQVALAIEKWQPDAVLVDQTGLGAGVVDRLRQLGHVVVGVEFGGKALSGRYANRRAEMWWALADWVRTGGCIPDDAELVAELTAPTYRFDAAGRLALEPKNDMKRRGLPSPDKADALALTFAAPVARRGPRLAREAIEASPVDYDPFDDGHGHVFREGST